jgi:hypothetical protein
LLHIALAITTITSNTIHQSKFFKIEEGGGRNAANTRVLEGKMNLAWPVVGRRRLPSVVTVAGQQPYAREGKKKNTESKMVG